MSIILVVFDMAAGPAIDVNVVSLISMVKF